jgi:hypothetical protein
VLLIANNVLYNTHLASQRASASNLDQVA